MAHRNGTRFEAPSVMTSSTTLTFAGGAGTVTGSKHLVVVGNRRVLLDCGLFQGLKALRLRNWAEPPFDPRALDAVVLSHAHLDHSGYLPLLVKRGFRGPVYCTAATAELVAVVLRDSARLQEDDAARANRYHYTKHQPALPLYSRVDVEAALSLLQPRPYGEAFDVAGSGQLVFRRAGHILGSATIDLQLPSVRIAFSGDLGRWNRPILRDPESVPEADVVLIESTYGDRLHTADADVDAQLEQTINETAARGGVVVVPSFAIGRTQELLWRIRALEDAGRLSSLSVALDSPMAIEVGDIYGRHAEDHSDAMRQLVAHGAPLRPRSYQRVHTAEESKALNSRSGPMVIIAGSGMAAGGRVLHHLKQRLPDARNTVLLCGFQAEATRGRALQEGARTIRIHGEMVPVRARVATIDGLSAHADQGELLRWLGSFDRRPSHVYVVHGEAKASTALANAIKTRLGLEATVAVDGATVAV